MATAAFSRDAPTMADMGYGAAELDALVKSAGDAVLDAAPTYRGDPDGREFDESVENEVDTLDCPHCGGKVPRG
jgi:hypothetical protein